MAHDPHVDLAAILGCDVATLRAADAVTVLHPVRRLRGLLDQFGDPQAGDVATLDRCQVDMRVMRHPDTLSNVCSIVKYTRKKSVD
jgi:hypothetical protein